jgi:hypothetical protein
MLRKCRSCGLEAHTEEELSLFVFGKNNKHGRRLVCKACANKQWQAQPNYQDIILKARYGITTDDYNQMFIEQEGCCAICNIHQKDTKKRLYVDHCHDTGKVRQLLCQHCNTLLGFARDDTKVLSEAIKYINKHKE